MMHTPAPATRPMSRGMSFHSQRDPSLPTMPDTPSRLHGFMHSSRSLNITPAQGQSTDWEGFSQLQVLQQQVASASSQTFRGQPQPQTQLQRQQSILRGSPSISSLGNTPIEARSIRSGSVSVLEPSVEVGREQVGRIMGAMPRAQPPHPNDYLLEHQAFLEYRRQEYKKRLAAEANGEFYQADAPYSEAFANSLPGGQALLTSRGPTISIDFESRTRKLFAKPQIIGSKEEVAWLQPPEIPQPVGWNGFWDLCSGHELILQIMAVSGANADNSPSLTEHFMYPELLSCCQRLQYGSYLVHYTKNERPHERYFYVKSLPLANKAQFCPFLCFSLHRHAHQALDAIPLCNIMWVTHGLHTDNFLRYALGGDFITGPFVGKHKSELLTYGAFTVWIYDGQATKGIDLIATDPLSFTMWMKLLEDVAQLNAALDVTGSVRALQRDLEQLLEKGELRDRQKKVASSMLASDD